MAWSRTIRQRRQYGSTRTEANFGLTSSYARRLDGVVDTPSSREILNCFDDVTGRSVDRVSRATLLGEVQPVVLEVDGDNLRARRDGSACDK
jgi:hypothetical protein